MYRKESEGFLKHYDFVLLDMFCLQLAFVFAYWIYGNGRNVGPKYRSNVESSSKVDKRHQECEKSYVAAEC